MNLPGYVDVNRWVGQDAEPLDPAAMQFGARLAPADAGDCSGCLFRGQKSKVCMAAGAAARRAGLPDCEDQDAETGRTFVYHQIKNDPRQMRIVTEGNNGRNE